MSFAAVGIDESRMLPPIDVTPVHTIDSTLWQGKYLDEISPGSSVPARNGTICDPPGKVSDWDDVRSSVSLVPDWILERLGSIYAFRPRAEVAWFIRNAPFLVGVLVKAAAVIPKYFGRCLLALEVFADPEEYADQRLTVYIITTMPADKALEALDQLDRDWWLETSSMAMGKLSINLEFIDEL